jgi:hypothetical protein
VSLVIFDLARLKARMHLLRKWNAIPACVSVVLRPDQGADDMRYELDAPDVVYEDFGSDGVILNLRSGAYFSLSERAKTLFEVVVSSADTDAFLTQLQRLDLGIVTQARSFLDLLLQEGLIRATGADGTFDDPDATCSALINGGAAFVFESHSDLADVIAADPIHDFNPETGLPV